MNVLLIEGARDSLVAEIQRRRCALGGRQDPESQSTHAVRNDPNEQLEL